MKTLILLVLTFIALVCGNCPTLYCAPESAIVGGCWHYVFNTTFIPNYNRFCSGDYTETYLQYNSITGLIDSPFTQTFVQEHGQVSSYVTDHKMTCNVLNVFCGYLDLNNTRRIQKDSLILTNSKIKPFVNLALVLKVEDGTLEYDEPISEQGWSAFGSNGKSEITPEDIISDACHLLTALNESLPLSVLTLNGFDSAGILRQHMESLAINQTACQRAYNILMGAQLIDMFLRVSTGQSPQEILDQYINVPFGLNIRIGLFTNSTDYQNKFAMVRSVAPENKPIRLNPAYSAYLGQLFTFGFIPPNITYISGVRTDTLQARGAFGFTGLSTETINTTPEFDVAGAGGAGSADHIAIAMSLYANRGFINSTKKIGRKFVDDLISSSGSIVTDALYLYSEIHTSKGGFLMNSNQWKFSNDTTSVGHSGAEGTLFYISNNHPAFDNGGNKHTSYVYSHASSVQTGGSDGSPVSPMADVLKDAFEKDVTSYNWNF